MNFKEYIKDQFRWFKESDKKMEKKPIRSFLALFMTGMILGGLAHIFIPLTTTGIMERHESMNIETEVDLWRNNYIYASFVILISFASITVASVSFVSNGIVIGNLALFSARIIDPIFPIIGFLPHGIFEIPSFFICPLIALEYKRGNKKKAIKIVILVVLLIFVAGLMEQYVTSYLLDWYVSKFYGIQV